MQQLVVELPRHNVSGIIIGSVACDGNRPVATVKQLHQVGDASMIDV
jgi:hypothetical protein